MSEIKTDEAFTLINKITMDVAETEEDFIFYRISSFCEEIVRRRISKHLLVRALTYFKENCPEEFDTLAREVEEVDGYYGEDEDNE